MVTVGLPAADPAAAVVRPMTIATASETAYAAFAARRVCFRTTAPPFGRRFAYLRRTLRFRFRSGRHEFRYKTEQNCCEQSQCRDAVRGADDALQAVARLVDDDLAEAAAAGDC